MRARLAAAGLLVGLAAWPAAVDASGDFSCEAKWTLVAPSLDCASRIVIGPGNDTRVNLLLLLRDRAGLDGQGVPYAEPEWSPDYGHTFFEWEGLLGSLFPLDLPEDGVYPEPPPFQGSRCQSIVAGGDQFLAAVERNRRIGTGDRAALAEGRSAMLGLCQAGVPDSGPASLADLDLPHRFASPEAREFAAYQEGAAAFYLGDWQTARERFASLGKATDAWVREAGLYMSARSELGAAAAAAAGEWGYFDIDKADKTAAARAGRTFEAYLAAYPRGQYAGSAAGLMRRASWLEGAVARQGELYAGLLAAADADDPGASELIDEIDNKFLFQPGASQAAEGPWLLAVHDLLRMRSGTEDNAPWGYGTHGLAPLTAAELAGQEAAFAGHPELYGFLRANLAFYLDHDYPAVLRLIPDDARKPAYDPLAFSRQVLRGMALAELGDRNEAGFWRELLGGARGLYQRPTVELAIALNWERTGQVAKVFAPDSPIEDARTRKILLENSAGPDVLRGVARASGRAQAERDLAAYVLLYKELTRAAYAAAAQDLALVRADAPVETYSDETGQTQTPLGLFTRGTFSGDYACPALRQTVDRLARDPHDARARLCLGDFYRLNGFDYLTLDGARQQGELGSFATYPGDPVRRDRLYSDIIAEPGIAREERAYALYRAVNCYAPAGSSSCGPEQVPETQRRAWFRRLKGEFADTRWARELEYYW